MRTATWLLQFDMTMVAIGLGWLMAMATRRKSSTRWVTPILTQTGFLGWNQVVHRAVILLEQVILPPRRVIGNNRNTLQVGHHRTEGRIRRLTA